MLFLFLSYPSLALKTSLPARPNFVVSHQGNSDGATSNLPPIIVSVSKSLMLSFQFRACCSRDQLNIQYKMSSSL